MTVDGKSGRADHEKALQHSQTYHILSWRDPQVSATILLTFTSLYFFHVIVGWTVPRIAATFLSIILAGNGILRVFNVLRQDEPVNPVTIPTAREKTRSLGIRLIEMGLDEAERFNKLLNWSDTRKSLRALSISFMAIQCSILLEPTPLFLVILAAFAAAPAYRHYGQEVLEIYFDSIRPHVLTLSSHLEKRKVISQWLDSCSHNTRIAICVGTLVVVSLLWYYLVPLRIILTVFASVHLAYEGLNCSKLHEA